MLPLSLFDSFLFYHIFYLFSIASNKGAYSASFSAGHCTEIFRLHTEYQKPILLYMRIFLPAKSFSSSLFLSLA